MTELRAHEATVAEALSAIHEHIAHLRKQDDAIDVRDGGRRAALHVERGAVLTVFACLLPAQKTLDELQAVNKEGRRRIAALNKQQQDVTQQAAKVQNTLDQLRGRKHGLLKKCKVGLLGARRCGAACVWLCV